MKHRDLEQVDILSFGPPHEVCQMLRRQFPSTLRRRLLFEVREWEDKPWVAVYIMEREEPPNLVTTEVAPGMPRILTRSFILSDNLPPHPRITLGWRTSKLLDVYSSPLMDRPRRYKNRIVHRATVDPVLKGWVLLRM